MKRITADIDRFDVWLHRKTRGLPPGGKQDTVSQRLGDEMFERLYSAEPLKQLDPRDILDRPNTVEYAKNVHSEADAMPEFSRLCQNVRGDEIGAALATEEILSVLESRVREREHREGVNDKNKSPERVRRDLRKAVSQAVKAVEEGKDIAEGMAQVSKPNGQTGPGYGDGTGDLQVQANPRIDLIHRAKNDPRLRLIAKLAGRFKRIAARKMKTRVKHGADEITDIETGDNLSRLIPTELARLSGGLTKLAFFKDYTEKACLQYQLRGSETLGKGPIIVCLDKSSSMRDHGRDEWATAIAIALLSRAAYEKRDFGIIMFNGGVTHRMYVRVTKGEKLDHSLLHVLPYGGTSFEAAINAAIDMVKNNGSTAKKADIVMVTDGDGGIGTDFQESIKALESKVYGVCICESDAQLKTWCHKTVVVQDMEGLNDKTAEVLFGEE